MDESDVRLLNVIGHGEILCLPRPQRFPNCRPLQASRPATVELAARDPLAHRRVQASWDHLETSLTSALVRAQAQDELPESSDPRAIARFLLVLMQGLRVVGRSDDDPGRARDAVAYALATLG